MSWSIPPISITDDGLVANQIGRAVTEYESANEATLTEAMREQIDAVIPVVNQIIESGAVGPVDGGYIVTLSGHANPDHLPASGWANDCVTVYVASAAKLPATTSTN